MTNTHTHEQKTTLQTKKTDANMKRSSKDGHESSDWQKYNFVEEKNNDEK